MADAIHGVILTPGGFLRGRLSWAGQRITSISGVQVPEGAVRELGLPLLLPVLL